MSNLLEKASIITTPTAYSEGKLHSVKPEQTIGNEIVINGDFSDGVASWNGSKAVTNGQLTKLNTGLVYQEIIDVSVKYCTISIDVDTLVAGLTVYLGGAQQALSQGINTLKMRGGGSNNFVGFNNGDGSIINSISVKEIFNADLDFQRSTNATRLNSQGLIENVGVDLPRIDYTDGCGSFLLEKDSVNFINYSEDISSWNLTINTVVEASSETFPDGLNNGFKIYANASDSEHRIEPNPRPPAAAGENATLSFFVKSAGSDFIQIATSSGFPGRYQNFNVSTGAKGNGDVSGSSITDFGNGWYRVSVTEIATGTSARYLIIPILSDGGRNPRFAGNANQDGVYIWGVQAEREVSEPSSYIPTSGTLATRVEDAVSRTGLSPYINGVEGTFYFEGKANSAANITLYTSINQRLWIEFNETDTRAFLNNGSGAVALNINSETVDFDSYRKAAFSYKENEFKLYVNGVGNTITPTQTTFGVNDLDGINLGIGNKFYGNVKELVVFKEALTNEELSELTTI